MAAPAPRASRLPAAERRRRVLRAFVAEALACGSVARVAMRAVAERAGCTAPILYRLFGSRAALVRAAVRSTHEPLLERMETIAAARTGSARERIEAFARRFLAEAPGPDEAFEALVFNECATDPDLAREVRGVFGRFETLLAQLVREGIRAGEFRGDVDPVFVAWRLIDVGLFRNQMRLMRLETPEAIDYGSRALDALLDEIAA